MTALAETVVELADPEAGAREIAALNSQLSEEIDIPDAIAAAVDELTARIGDAEMSRWNDVSPPLALTAFRAVIAAQRAVAHRDADDSRDALRLALAQLSQSLSLIAEEEPVAPGRSEKEVARWLVEVSGVSQREIADVLDVGLRTFQRWLSVHEATSPDGDEAFRLRALAMVINQLRWTMTGPGVLRWLAAPNARLDGGSPAHLLSDPESIGKLTEMARSLRDPAGA